MKIAFVGVLSKELLIFHGEMLRTLAADGHEVLAVAPDEDARVEARLREMDVAFRTVPLHRAGMNPFRDAYTTFALIRLFRGFRPEVVLLSAAKPVIYGSIAARLSGARVRSAMITGVGSVLGASEKGLLARLLWSLYSIASRQLHVIFFQNPDDEALFRSLHLIRHGQSIVRINGTGVDLDRFHPTAVPPPPTVFLMVARLIRDKGVVEFVHAAGLVRRQRPEARFQLLGPLDPNPTGISERELDEIRRAGVVEYLGVTDDVRPYWSAAHVCVLPSYREGTPVSVLEAMAMGRPIIATDVPGCRETVEDGRNGRLVAVRDPEALAAAMLDAIDHPDHWKVMGTTSRAIAEARYDVHVVNQVILAALGLESGPVEPMP